MGEERRQPAVRQELDRARAWHGEDEGAVPARNAVEDQALRYPLPERQGEDPPAIQVDLAQPRGDRAGDEQGWPLLFEQQGVGVEERRLEGGSAVALLPGAAVAGHGGDEAGL